MYAIIKCNGSQCRVAPGTVFETNRLAFDAGTTATLSDSVLLVNSDGDLRVGTPVLEGAEVDLEVMDHHRGKKIVVFKMKRRKHNRRKQGHRQELSRVRVVEIRLGDGTVWTAEPEYDRASVAADDTAATDADV